MRRTLGLDVSSKNIGWVLLEEGKARFSGEFKLKGEIDERIEAAHEKALGLIDAWQPTAIGIESPVGRFAGAVIPQARVSGGVILAAKQRKIPWLEVTPTEGKKRLAGTGKATKEQMIKAAAPLLGLDPTRWVIKEVSSEWRAYSGGEVQLVEHTADAVGIALVVDSWII